MTTTKSQPNDFITLRRDTFVDDVRSILAERGQVAVIWSCEDVQSIRPDLNDQESFAVLSQAVRNHDAECGISWDTLSITADMLFPSPAGCGREDEDHTGGCDDADADC